MFSDGVTIGGIAQLGERLLCKQEVVGSIPSASTSSLVSRDAEPLSFEDRWKEPQHGNVDQSERAALALVPRSTRAEAGSWTSEDEVQVTEDAPRPAEPTRQCWLGVASNGEKQPTLSVGSRAGLFLRVAQAFSLELRSSV